MRSASLADAIDSLEPSPYEHAIIEKFACLDRLVASLIADLDSFDRDGMWAVCGATSLRAWLTHACLRTRRDASSYVRTMQLLRSLPSTTAAFAGGTLAKGHVDVIAANVHEQTLPLFAEIETELVPHLSALSISDATAAMRVWAANAAVAVGGADGTEPEQFETDQLHVSEMLDTTFKLDGVLVGESATIVNAALALCRPEQVEGEPVRTFAQRQADALVEMAHRVLQVTDTTVTRSTDAMLLIPFDSYVNGGLASFADGTIVTPLRLRRLLCDAVITPLVQGDDGQPLWMGQAIRSANKAQRRALVARDRHCAFPGCKRPASWTEAHHIDEWSRDHGPTDIDNLCLLCTTHHSLIHQPGWHAKLAPDQTLVVTTPQGRVLRQPPWAHVHRPCTKPPPTGPPTCASGTNHLIAPQGAPSPV